jgi:hypothetical protein
MSEAGSILEQSSIGLRNALDKAQQDYERTVAGDIKGASTVRKSYSDQGDLAALGVVAPLKTTRTASAGSDDEFVDLLAQSAVAAEAAGGGDGVQVKTSDDRSSSRGLDSDDEFVALLAHSPVAAAAASSRGGKSPIGFTSSPRNESFSPSREIFAKPLENNTEGGLAAPETAASTAFLVVESHAEGGNDRASANLGTPVAASSPRGFVARLQESRRAEQVVEAAASVSVGSPVASPSIIDAVLGEKVEAEGKALAGSSSPVAALSGDAASASPLLGANTATLGARGPATVASDRSRSSSPSRGFAAMLLERRGAEESSGLVLDGDESAAAAEDQLEGEMPGVVTQIGAAGSFVAALSGNTTAAGPVVGANTAALAANNGKKKKKKKGKNR